MAMTSQLHDQNHANQLRFNKYLTSTDQISGVQAKRQTAYMHALRAYFYEWSCPDYRNVKFKYVLTRFLLFLGNCHPILLE